MPFNRAGSSARLIAAVLVLAGIAVVIAGIVFPVASVPRVEPTPRAATSPSASQPAAVIDPAELADLDLHKPLLDVPPPLPPPTADSAGLQGLRLTGTIIEPLHCYAIFTMTDGSTQIRTVGDRAAGAQLTAVTADAVTLLFNGQSIVLHVVKPEPVGRFRL